MTRLMTARRADGERGLIAILLALSVVAFTLIAALVLDLGQLRSDRRANKAITDLAARAGISRVPFGPWSGVCRARQYLIENGRGFSALDAGSETWSNAATPPTAYSSSPCPANTLTPDTNPCVPGAPASWARLQATAGGGRFRILIQSGYAMPDPAYTEDAARGDTGDPDLNGCDNLVVTLTEKRKPSFAQVAGFKAGDFRIRSVGRLNTTQTLQFVAALQLLEHHDCNVLQVGGSNTRVVSQPYGSYPGTIQIDSADDGGSCPQPILNSQATSGGPAVLACSTNSTYAGCTPGTGANASRIGLYALNYNRPAGHIATEFQTTYGDTRVIASPRVGRRPADVRYRQNVSALDNDVKTMLAGNSGKPPGCPSVVDNTCTGADGTWLVLAQSDCNSLASFFSSSSRTSAARIWFDCNLDVNTNLVLSAPGAWIVVTGKLAVSNTFTITDPRRVYIGGESTGSKVGLEVKGSGSTLNVNLGSSATCPARTGAGFANRMVIGAGSFQVGSGAHVHLCQTFTLLASGFNKIPNSDGTAPCQSSACNTYTGTLSVSSGGLVDWSAANEITGRVPSAQELTLANQFEDLALWTDAGGNSNSMSGGSETSLAGAFFMPNANSFNLAGNGSLPIYLSAQFIASTMKVTGGATVNLVPNPFDSIPTYIYNTLLVR
ncbi:MAG: pilus assembly protein TadG-related protein [Acidimicrobiales bacterium]